MARPKKEGMDYFPHDTDAVNDKKIEALRALYGNDGYAYYFIMLEQIYKEKNFQLDVSDAETREEMFQVLSKKVSVSMEVFMKILNTSLKWGCFDKRLYDEKGVITSEGIKKRANVVVEKRVKMREKYQSDKEIIFDAETTQETMEETTQSKVKKSKEKKNKYKEYVLLTNEEYQKLIESFGETKTVEMIERLNNYIGSKGKRYKSHYHTILNWVNKDKKDFKPEGNGPDATDWQSYYGNEPTKEPDW